MNEARCVRTCVCLTWKHVYSSELVGCSAVAVCCFETHCACAVAGEIDSPPLSDLMADAPLPASVFFSLPCMSMSGGDRVVKDLWWRSECCVESSVPECATMMAFFARTRVS